MNKSAAAREKPAGSELLGGFIRLHILYHAAKTASALRTGEDRGNGERTFSTLFSLFSPV